MGVGGIQSDISLHIDVQISCLCFFSYFTRSLVQDTEISIEATNLSMPQMRKAPSSL